MTFGMRFARLATDAVVRSPRLWPLFRAPMRRQFDAIARDWDNIRTPGSFDSFEAALAAVDTTVRDALDVGTGTGEGALAIARRFPEARIVGIDVSPGMLAEARRKAPPGAAIEFIEADAAAIPYGAGSFDLVAHANMIPFFDEVARLLRPGGWALFAFSVGPETPIYVAPDRLRAELSRRGFADFAEFAAGPGTAFVGRKR